MLLKRMKEEPDDLNEPYLSLNEVNAVFYHAHKRSLEVLRATYETQQISHEGKGFRFFFATLRIVEIPLLHLGINVIEQWDKRFTFR